MRALHFHCHSGVSGDMLLGALVDLGAPVAALNDSIAKLGITGLSLQSQRVNKSGISACKVDVKIESQVKLTHYRDARETLQNAELAESVKSRALAALRSIAAAEAKIHDADIETVHFHELGSLDTIADVVGVFAALEYLEVDAISCSPIAVGAGVISIDHGTVPNPAPATLELLRGLELDRTELSGERATPTGVAILKTLFEDSALQIDRSTQRQPILRGIGYGAGTADFTDRVNVLRAELSELSVSTDIEVERDQIVQIETTIDDMNPQLYGHIFERLYAAGAHEVFVVPVLMKKSRPGQNLVVLAPEWKLQTVAEIVLTESTSSGVRYQRMERIKAERELKEVLTEYGEVMVKRISYNGITRWQPEYDSCLALARKANLPLTEILQAARIAAESLGVGEFSD